MRLPISLKKDKKVSEAVRAGLYGEFDNINTNIAQQIVSSFFVSIISSLANDIAHNDKITGISKQWINKNANIEKQQIFL